MAKPKYTDLAHYLEATGTRQEDFAERVGTTQGHVSRIAAGEVVPRPELLERMAEEADIPMDSFIKVYLATQEAKEANA